VSLDWQARARESYDRVAKPYADLTRSATTSDVYMAGDYARLAALAKGDPRGGKATVVDVGCGPGWWVQYLAEHGVDSVGIDLSPAMIDLARTHVPDAAFHVGSVLDLPLASQSVAGVCCMYLLHHLPDDDVGPALAEIGRVLMPGGVLMLGGHIGVTRVHKTEGYGGLPMDVHVNRRPATVIEDAALETGFVIEAHTIYDPGEQTATHTLFARRPDSSTP